MPYINYVETDDNYNYYKPSDSLQNLFENKVIAPLRGITTDGSIQPERHTRFIGKLFWSEEERILMNHVRIILRKIRYYFIVSIICLCISIAVIIFTHDTYP